MNIERDMMVNYSVINLLSEGIDKHHRDVEASMDTLTGKLDLMGNSWDNESKEACVVRRREWSQEGLEMRSTLQQFNVKVFNAELGYHGVEVQNRRVIDDVEISKA